MSQSSDRHLGVPTRGDATRSHDLARVRPWPRAELDRLASARDDQDELSRLFAGACVVAVGPDGQFPVEQGVEPGSIALVATQEDSFDPQRHVLLGRTHGRVWFARSASPDEAESWSASDTLRSGGLSDAEREIAEPAVGFLTWHRTEPVCERCHATTSWVPGGASRRCAQGHENFPRTDPAVIMAVRDASGRLLLAHQASWPQGRCSVLAGFIESGESAEAAVAREVAEEVGLSVGEVRYVHSQAWPFPRSLMLGFSALAEGDPVPDGVEIAWARWFTRDEVAAELDAGTLTLPGEASIAGRLIERWRADAL